MRPIKITILLTLMVLTFPSSAQQAMDYQYFYDIKGQLSKTVDSQGIVIDYIYDKLGNILETRRSSVSGLALFGFTPSKGAKGSTVTLQGQEFSTTLLDNTVRFNGAIATVQNASNTLLKVIVPDNATSGLIEVTVNGISAQSTTNFTIPPVINSITPNLVVSASTIADLQVVGENLDGVNFNFLPTFLPPYIVVNTSSINNDGKSAILDISIADNAQGILVLMAKSAAGTSERIPLSSNSLVILDAQGDEDGDGISNSVELALGSNPNDSDSDNDGWPDNIEFEFNGNLIDPGVGPKLSTTASTELLLIRHGLDNNTGLANNTTLANPELVLIRYGLDNTTNLPANTTLANPPVSLHLVQ